VQNYSKSENFQDMLMLNENPKILMILVFSLPRQNYKV